MFSEKTLSSERVYDGRIVSVRKEIVQLQDGSTAQREIVDHEPAVVIIPFQSREEIYLVRQFRKPFEDILIEAPAGMVNPGEDFLFAAKRELREETGLSAKKWVDVGEAYPAPGFCNERLLLFLACDLGHGDTEFDIDENLELMKVSLDEFELLIKTGEIKDAKTQILFYRLKDYFAHV